MATPLNTASFLLFIDNLIFRKQRRKDDGPTIGPGGTPQGNIIMLLMLANKENITFKTTLLVSGVSNS